MFVCSPQSKHGRPERAARDSTAVCAESYLGERGCAAQARTEAPQVGSCQHHGACPAVPQPLAASVAQQGSGERPRAVPGLRLQSTLAEKTSPVQTELEG